MYCEKCGKPLSDNDAFCAGCGAKTARAAYAQPVINPVSKTERPFSSNYLAFLIMGLLFLIALVIGAVTGRSFTLSNVNHIIWPFAQYAIIACAVVLTTRAKGPDFSIGSLMALSSLIFAHNLANEGAFLQALLPALLICIVIGLINGMLIVFLRLPAVVVTVVVATILRPVTLAISDYQTLALAELDFVTSIRYMLIETHVGALLVCFAAAFLIVFFSKLGRPVRQRIDHPRPIFNKYIVSVFIYTAVAAIINYLLDGRVPQFLGMSLTEILRYLLVIVMIFIMIKELVTSKSTRAREDRPVAYVMAYVTSALFAVIAGILVALRVNAAFVNMGVRNDYILFVFACALSSRVIDNKKLSVISAVGTALFWAFAENLLIIMGTNIYLQVIFLAAITLVFLVIANLVNKDKAGAHVVDGQVVKI